MNANQPQPTARLRPFRPVQFGRYTLLAQLATGGMGEIFLARIEGAQGFEKLCVIKKILPHLAQDMDFVERFVNEAKTLVKLSHGSIAQVLDMGLHEGDPFLALEHVDGKDLRKVAARMRERHLPPPLTFVLYVMSRVLDALAYAHRKRDEHERELNLVHRDISPQNILVSYEGEVKVIDFGLAKSTLSVARTSPSIILGKFLYMAPEQARHQRVDRRSDLYSVGLCLYELVTGKNPFEAVPPGEMVTRVANPGIPSLQSVDPLCPRSVSQVVMRALEVDPEDRFQTAEDFRAKLMSALVEIDPSAGPETVSKFMRETFASEYQAERRLLASLKDSLRVQLPQEPSTLVETGVHQRVPIPDIDTLPFPASPARKETSEENALPSPPLSYASYAAGRPLTDIEPTRPIQQSPYAASEQTDLITEHDIPVLLDEPAQGAPPAPIPEVKEPLAEEPVVPATDPQGVVVKASEGAEPFRPQVVDVAPSRAPVGKLRTGPRARPPEEPQAQVAGRPPERAERPGPRAGSASDAPRPAPNQSRPPTSVWAFIAPIILVTLGGVAYVLWDLYREEMLSTRPPEIVVEAIAQPPPVEPEPVPSPSPEAASPSPAPVPSPSAEPVPSPSPEVPPSSELEDEDIVAPLTPLPESTPPRKIKKKKPTRREASAFLREWTKVRLSYEELVRRQPCEMRSMALLCERYATLKTEVVAAEGDRESQERLLGSIQSLRQLIEQKKTGW